jgi:hypothetical protein
MPRHAWGGRSERAYDWSAGRPHRPSEEGHLVCPECGYFSVQLSESHRRYIWLRNQQELRGLQTKAPAFWWENWGPLWLTHVPAQSGGKSPETWAIDSQPGVPICPLIRVRDNQVKTHSAVSGCESSGCRGHLSMQRHSPHLWNGVIRCTSQAAMGLW